MPSDAGRTGFTFANISTGVGLASSVIGLIQFFQQHGKSILERLWDTLYSLGFIGALSLIFTILVGMGCTAVVSSLQKNACTDFPDKSTERKMVFFSLFVGIALGTWLGLSAMHRNDQVLAMNALERLRAGGPFALSPTFMRVLGIATLLLPVASWISLRWDKPGSSTTPPT